MGRGGVSDANEKHSNKVARGALYCNSICTLMIGIVVLIVAAVNVMHTQRARIKVHLCSNASKAHDGQADVQKMLRAAHFSLKQFPTQLLCSQLPGRRGHKTSCQRHEDCDGTVRQMYCDEDFVCWDCRFQDRTSKCDAFDEDCSMCAATKASRVGKKSNISTMVYFDDDVPDGVSMVSTGAQLAVFFAIVAIINALFGIFGDVCNNTVQASCSRGFLFVHHFLDMLLCLVGVYAVGACFVIKAKHEDLVRSYWPWIRESFEDDVTIPEAADMIDTRIMTVAALCSFLIVSLACGAVASARLLGVEAVTRHILMVTNSFTAVFGMGMQLMALRAALNGYGWSVLIVLGLVGGVSSLLGVVGVIGVWTNRPELLTWQFRGSVPVAFLTLVLAFEALVWQPREWVHAKLGALQRQWGLISEKEAVTLLETHVGMIALMALVACSLMVLNLVCTRLLISRLVIGAQYHRVSSQDIDMDYMDETGAAFEIGDDDDDMEIAP